MSDSVAQLEKEARYLHQAFFRTPPPAEVDSVIELSLRLKLVKPMVVVVPVKFPAVRVVLS